MKFATSKQLTSRGGRSATGQLAKALTELADAVREVGGTDEVIGEFGGDGTWDVTDPDVREVATATDNRTVTGQAARINDGTMAGVREAAVRPDYFEATGLSDGEHHGEGDYHPFALVPKLSDLSDDVRKAYLAARAEHGTNSTQLREACEELGIETRDVNGGELVVRYVTSDSELWDADKAARFWDADEAELTE